MIKDINFSNYRAFKESQSLKLAPLTIIIGKNNSGKSALLKLPVIIKSALQTDKNEVCPKEYRGLSFCHDYIDLVYGKGAKAITLTMESTDNDNLEVRFFVEKEGAEFRTIIEYWKLTENKGEIFEYNLISTNGSKDDTEIITFKGFIPCFRDEEKNKKISQILKHFDYEVEYVSAIRKAPSLDYRAKEPSFYGVGVEGENTYEWLITDKNFLYDKVKKWYSDNFDGWQFNIDRGNAPLFYFNFLNNGLKVNILETGTGIIQSMPIVVSVCLKPGIPTISIYEEPEAHLHPAAHASLAQLMAEEVKDDKNKTIIAETHSLNFILRLRALVAEKYLDPSDLAIYNVRFDEEKHSSVLERIEVDNQGNVSHWPKDVFNESLNEAIRIRKAQF